MVTETTRTVQAGRFEVEVGVVPPDATPQERRGKYAELHALIAQQRPGVWLAVRTETSREAKSLQFSLYRHAKLAGYKLEVKRRDCAVYIQKCEE